MDKRGANEGFRVLGDFVCEAIRDPAVPQAPPSKRGQNEGVRVLEEPSLNIAPIPQGEKSQCSAIGRFIRWFGKGVRNLFNAFST
jgi:hypothetical protein